MVVIHCFFVWRIKDKYSDITGQYLLWIHSHMGADNRRVVPCCYVWQLIKKQFKTYIFFNCVLLYVIKKSINLSMYGR